MRRAIIGCLLTALSALAGGCATVSAPMNLADPVPIYLAEYSVHSDVYMPRDGAYIAYTFGDWNYAALHHTWPNDAVGALTISGASALERRTAKIDPRTGEPILYDGPELVIRLFADRRDVERRLKQLDERFAHDLQVQGPSGVVTNDDKSRVYVKDDEHYSVANDCNDLTAGTLRELGFRVNGVIVGSHFHVSESEIAPPATPSSSVADSP